ncbi:DUF1801 domain-containing protein [Parvibaculum sp.]|jgi:hypothetical protein|uniref:DUF1801 domain-containing protein n=1 Tax=Parvibaculum sp. TaxID=2024848 RepID=UPI002FDB717D
MTKRKTGGRFRPFADPKVAAVFESYPAPVRARLMALRETIFDVAEATEGVGAIEEMLKWGQPAYLTTESGSGTTIRLDGTQEGSYGLYVHCQTTLVDNYRALYDGVLRFEGNRAVLFDAGDRPPKAALEHCIRMALTYKLKGKAEKRR